MKRAWIGIGAALAFLLSAGFALAGDLGLKRVMLSSGGVAYLEFEAEIEGDAELPLDVPLDQVDDVLKSIVVFDSKGGIGSVSLPGREPLAQGFRDLPFDQHALDTPEDLLNALQGAEIKIGGNRPLAGKLLRVVPEIAAIGPGQGVTRHRVTLLTAAGLQQFVLEEADSLSFADPALQPKIDQALSQIAANRAKDRRRLVLSARGTGKRVLRVGYVVGAPLWKTSFRLVLPDDVKAMTAHLQGWAVLENMSGQDWRGVELTLLSGNPVSFRQAIYEAYYVTRPEVPVDVVGHILPKRDTSSAENAVAMSSGAAGAMSPEPEFVPEGLRRGGRGAPMAALDNKSAAKPRLAPSVDTAEATEAATQIAFRVPVPVSVASGYSEMVPIIDREMPVQRWALYQPATLAAHPLASLRLKNDSSNGLPPGVVTLYERGAAAASYIGDAQLAALPAGDSRLISYAADEKTQISVTSDETEAIAHAAIAEGVLHLRRLARRIILYHLKAPTTEPRHVLIEQPKLPGWALTAPAGKPPEEIPQAYRFPLELAPGQSGELQIVFEQPREESLRILDYNDDQIGAMVAEREIEPKIRAAFTELARLRREVAARKSAIDDIGGQIGELNTDQGRIRQNLGSADRDSDLHKRYMTKLAEQETRMESLQAARAKAETEAQTAEAAVKDYVAKLTL